ncbi:MAG: antitoxin VbhA family protein [Lachnospiraceae bacterium]|nr:antitoxin VbhA family protein [Lachnospiraceae bacterium]
MLVKADKKWDYALGMIKVDGLEPTPEMQELIKKEKRGEISMEEVKKALDRKYKMKQ